MSNHLIIAPDGRVVTCPRHLTRVEVVADEAVTSVNVDALKPGWRVAAPSAEVVEIAADEPLNVEQPAGLPVDKDW